MIRLVEGTSDGGRKVTEMPDISHANNGSMFYLLAFVDGDPTLVAYNPDKESAAIEQFKAYLGDYREIFTLKVTGGLWRTR